MKSKKVFIKWKGLLFTILWVMSLGMFAQNITVRGTVIDENNEPVVGATVIVVGDPTRGTVTDIDGKYTITNVPADASLEFRYVGMKTQVIPVDGRTTINVVMESEVKILEEVVVIGYGTQTRESLTGSVSNLTSDRIGVKPVSSIESALQGEIPGVLVVNKGGPGVSPTVRVRGIGSVNFSSDPLYVIDGIPVGDLNNFDVKDIESVSVLKDAASAAIYGSRAANGVVLITTKKGKRDGKILINLDVSTGFQQAWKTLDLLRRDEYIEFGTQLLTNAGLELPYRFSHMNEPIYEGATQTYAETETDWQDEMFRTAPMSQINLNLSGGYEKIRFYTSYGWFSQEGIMLGTDYNRHSIRVNTEYNVNKFFTIGENIKGSFSERLNEKESGGRTIIKHTIHQIPYIPVHDPTLLGGYRSADAKDGTDPENPVRIALMDKDKTDVVNLVGNAFAEISFTDWLKFRSNFGIEYTSNRSILNYPMYNDSFNQRIYHELTDNRFRYFSKIFTNQLTFNKTIGKHDINAVAVVEEQITNNTYLNGKGNHTTNDLHQLQGTSSQTLSGRLEETALISYAGRLNYAFADKYLLSASFRRDGSSVFAPGKKWGNFPGASIGWVLSKESFMQNVDFVSNLKLRASYGTLGFNAVGPYPWQSTIGFNTWAVFNNNAADNPGAYYDVLPNEDLEWEITKMTNIGFDAAFLDHSLTFSGDYFIRRVDNLLVRNPLAPSMGYSVDPLTNIGEMKNWGYEFTAGYSSNQNKDFKFSVTANLSIVKNKVIKLSTGAPFIDQGAVTSDYGGGTITRTEGGYPIQGFYGYVVDGIFQSQDEVDNLNQKALQKYNEGIIGQQYYQNEFTAPGDIKFKDLNGDGIVDDNDRKYIGHFMPDFSYGINFSADYKNFDVSMLIQGDHGNEIYCGTKVLSQGMMRLFNADKAVLNAWTPTNKNTKIPRAVSGDPNNNARTSDRFIEDGSYLRIKNLTVGYNFPDKVMSSLFKNAMTGLRLYITAQNLLTLTNYYGYDPEIASYRSSTLLQGSDFGQYPQPRTFLFGIRASF